MRAVFRSLILALLASLSMSVFAGPCESDVTPDYISISGTQFNATSGAFRAPDRMGTVRDFQFGFVLPNKEGTLLEKWAADHQASGLQLGVVRQTDVKEGIVPEFLGAYFPRRNLLLVYEERKLGVNLPVFKHEGRHAEFDQLLREGKCTVFAGQRIDSFEEIYTHAWHVLESEPDLRAYVTEAFLKEVMRFISIKPYDELGQFRESLEKIRNGRLPARVRRSVGTPLPTNLPRNATLLRSVEIETGSPFLMGIHHVEIHGRYFVAMTLLEKGLHPVSLLFAHPGNASGFDDLKLELGIRKFAGQRGEILLDLAIRRLGVLAVLTKASMDTFDTIEKEIAQGRTGQEAAKHLVELLEPYHIKIERPFSAEPETK